MSSDGFYHSRRGAKPAALRDYQVAAVAGIHSQLESGDSTLLVLATGTGKTEVFIHFAVEKLCAQGWRTLVIAPLNTLVHQTANKIFKRTGVSPDLEQAHLTANEDSVLGQKEFVVASAQTLCMTSKATGAPRYEKFTNIQLVVIDEGHMRLTKTTMKMVDWFKSRGAKVLAVTATPKRHDGVGIQYLAGSIAYEYPVHAGIDDGWLVNAQTQCVQVNSLDLSEVRTHGKKGDFVESSLAKAMEENRVVYEIADVTARESGTMKTAVYCASVQQARDVAHLLADNYGLKADWICADLKQCPKEKRRDVLRSFTRDPEGVQILANVGILTTGWDFPGLQHIVMARPTKSTALYQQVFGRGTRPLEGVVDFENSTPDLRKERIAASAKPFFTMTDLVDNSLAHKIITAPDILTGKYPGAVLRRAKELLRDGKGRKLGDAISEARELLDRERREELERRERERLAMFKATADYSARKVDPFDGLARGVQRRNEPKGTARFPFGKHQGSLVADVPTGYLEWALTTKLKGWLHDAVKRELANRTPDPPTPKMIGWLKWKRIPVPATRAEASRLISERKKLEEQRANGSAARTPAVPPPPAQTVPSAPVPAANSEAMNDECPF